MSDLGFAFKAGVETVLLKLILLKASRRRLHSANEAAMAIPHATGRSHAQGLLMFPPLALAATPTPLLFVV